MSVDEFGNLDAPMNSDHAPTAEEQLPPIPERRPDWDGNRAEFELTYRRDQLLAALRENREMKAEAKGWEADALEYRAKYKSLSEYHTNAMAEKDARIAELERKGGELCCVLGNLLIHVHELGLRNTEPYKYRNERAEAAEAKLRAVSDALDEKLERVDPGRYGKYRYVREKDFDAFNARIRAIVEGK